MDRMNIHSIVNFPTLASIMEVNFMDDPVATQVMIHAFNQWLFDEWGFNHQNRIYTTPVMNLSDPRSARSPSWSGPSSVAPRPCWCGRARSPASGARSRPSSPTPTRSGRPSSRSASR